MGNTADHEFGLDDRPASRMQRSVAGAIIGCLLTIPAALASIASAGLGHGNYFAAKMLYPYSYYIAYKHGEYTMTDIEISLLQYPLYGILLGMRGRRKDLPILVILAHVMFTIVCLNIKC
jgi:hypothetical protein